jgi:deazaflavin-dependent oxidoreductase (nitroreductase family)
MTERTYLKTPWMVRTVGARMAARFNPAVSRLSVPGRVTGRWHTVSVGVLEQGGQRYLVAASGDTDWSLNLRACWRGRLEKKGHVEEFTATDVPADERQPLIKAYLDRYGKMPTVAKTFRALPEPAQHPTFLIAPAPPP